MVYFSATLIPANFQIKLNHFTLVILWVCKGNKALTLKGSGQFDIRMTVEDFKCDVYAYSSWKLAMWIQVCHVRHKDLPTFVFPGGIRPSPPTRSTSESHSVQK